MLFLHALARCLKVAGLLSHKLLLTCGQPQGEISVRARIEQYNLISNVFCSPLACLIVVAEDD